MTTIGSTAPSIRHLDRAAYVQQVVERSNGNLTIERFTADLEMLDRVSLQGTSTFQRVMDGKATNLGVIKDNQRVWDPQESARLIDQARQDRSQYYTRVPGPVTIDALNVDAAVKIESKMSGDLDTLSYYADYLRNEVAAATQAKGEATFTGAWGKDRITSDVNEYIGWLFQASQIKSQVATDSRQAA